MLVGAFSEYCENLREISFDRALLSMLTVSVHGLCGMWGMIAVGIFAKEDTISEGFTFNAYNGVLYGDSYLLLVQVTRDT